MSAFKSIAKATAILATGAVCGAAAGLAYTGYKVSKWIGPINGDVRVDVSKCAPDVQKYIREKIGTQFPDSFREQEPGILTYRGPLLSSFDWIVDGVSVDFSNKREK